MLKKLSKEKRDRIILVTLGTMTMLAALYFGVVSAQRHKLETIAKQMTDQEIKVRNGERLVQTVAQIEERLQKVRQKLQAVETNMASGDMYAWVISTFNRFKQNHGVEIPQYSREVVGDVGLLPRFPYKAATFQFRGTAYYHDFGKFVADLENRFPHMRVQNIELEPAGGGARDTKDAEKLSFRLEVVVLVNPHLTQP